jgi:hypothetical protein
MEAKSIPPIETVHVKKSNDHLINVLTVVLLVGTVFMCLAFVAIFIHPQTPINPFPPVNLPQTVILPTSTPTLFPPTWTPTATLEPSPTREQPTELPTNAVMDTATPLPTETSTPAVQSTLGIMVTLTPLPAGAYPFSQRGETNMVSSAIIHPDQACSWSGVGGQVFDLQGAPLTQQIIQLTGGLEGKPINLQSLTGTATQYGQAGYEFYLTDHAVDSKQELSIQLLDQAGLPLSDKVTFDTSSDCQKNLVLINFRQVK